MKCEISFSLSGAELRKSPFSASLLFTIHPSAGYSASVAIKPSATLTLDRNKNGMLMNVQLIMRERRCIIIYLNPYCVC